MDNSPGRFVARDVAGARDDILENLQIWPDRKVIYFDGWHGFGASAVLRSLAQVLRSEEPRPGLSFDRVIYIDCSHWKSRRAMQRAIAEELKLESETMDLFDEQDEEDDFNGEDQGSRDVIATVSVAIDKTLRGSRFIMIFLNGSDGEVDVTRFGIPLTEYGNNVIVWTFRGWLFTMNTQYSHRAERLQHTHIFIRFNSEDNELSSSEFCALLREETATIISRNPSMRGIDPERIMSCCQYGLFLYLCLPKHLDNDWAARASAYWMCDGIIQGDQAWEISSTLSKETKWCLDPSLLEEVHRSLIESLLENSICFQRFKDIYFNGQRKSYPWMVITGSEILETLQDIQAKNTEVLSCFMATKRSDDVPLVLVDGLFGQSTKLRVLQLSHCAFSFASPPFIGCQNLRFIGLYHCEDSRTCKEEDLRKWQFLSSLLVLDLIYTGWYQVFSKEIADLFVNLRELNIVGVECSHINLLCSQLHNLYKLEIIKPTYQPETSTEINDSVMDSTKVGLVDFFGNKSMKVPSTLRFFRFDNEEPTPQFTPAIDILSLEGCIGLESLFLRRLPNLVELDLSGTAITILDFTTMVVEVSCLKRLFLLGCEELRAIKWSNNKLELLCIDTRPGVKYTRPSVDKMIKSFELQIYAIIVDARLVRSLRTPIQQQEITNVAFNIHGTSSTVCGGVVQPEGTCNNKIRQSDQVNLHQHFIPASQYHDVLSKVGDPPMQSFPQPPTKNLSRHIEIAQGCQNLERELNLGSLACLALFDAIFVAESLHVHDVSTSASMPRGGYFWKRLKWCRIERCLGMEIVFPADMNGFEQLETMWVSDLPMARWLWSKGSRSYDQSFQNLRHLHLRGCPRLKFVLPVFHVSFPSLETLHVIHCSDLRNIFVLDGVYPEEITVNGVAFPKLASIHLHDLPMLRQICDVEFKMVAPALQSIKIRGCCSLRRLPTVAARGPKPTVEIEKDVWDALEWDVVEAGHHPSLFQAPVHSCYYKKKLPRGSVLR